MANNCLIPGCACEEALALKRGLCMKHYSVANKKVKAGETTWQELAELGLARDDGAAKVDPFEAALAERRKNRAADHPEAGS